MAGAKNLVSVGKLRKIRSFSRQGRDQDDIFSGLATFSKKLNKQCFSPGCPDDSGEGLW
jgi:hypothetical protein